MQERYGLSDVLGTTLQGLGASKGAKGHEMVARSAVGLWRALAGEAHAALLGASALAIAFEDVQAIG